MDALKKVNQILNEVANENVVPVRAGLLVSQLAALSLAVHKNEAAAEVKYRKDTATHIADGKSATAAKEIARSGDAYGAYRDAVALTSAVQETIFALKKIIDLSTNKYEEGRRNKNTDSKSF